MNLTAKSVVTVTSTDFRSDRSRCSMLKRLMETAVFKEAIASIFEDLDLTESYIINRNPDASPNMELRLQNVRKGHNDFLNALKLMTMPHEKAPEMPEETYGAEKPEGWMPAEDLLVNL